MNNTLKKLFAAQQYKGIPVVTMKQLVEILSVGSSTVRSAICTNKDKFQEGVHYLKLNKQDLLSVKQEGVIPVNPVATILTLLTEKGVETYLNLKERNRDITFINEPTKQEVQIVQQEQLAQNSLVTIRGTRCYVDENNIAWLNAEDVARGLGFVDHQNKVSATDGRKIYEVIRWARVNGYLEEYSYPKKVGKDDYLPENMFYLLAMKANNETAIAFQLKIANEILPTLRRTGYYRKPRPAMTRDDFKQIIAKINIAEEQRILAIQKVSSAEKQLAAAKDNLASLENAIEDLYNKINVRLTETPDIKAVTVAAEVQPLLQDEAFTIGELHKLVENKVSVSELYDYAKTKVNLTGTFDRQRAKMSVEDAAILMATLGVKLNNLSQAVTSQTMTLQDVLNKINELGYNQNLSVTSLISLLKENNLPLKEQPHLAGFSSKNSTVTKQTFYSLLTLLGKPN